jgi:hypothetical protein
MRDFVTAYYNDLPAHPNDAWTKLDTHCQKPRIAQAPISSPAWPMPHRGAHGYIDYPTLTALA